MNGTWSPSPLPDLFVITFGLRNIFTFCRISRQESRMSWWKPIPNIFIISWDALVFREINFEKTENYYISQINEKLHLNHVSFQDTQKRNSSVKPMYSGSGKSMALLQILYYITGSWNLTMATAKPEILIYSCVTNILKVGCPAEG